MIRWIALLVTLTVVSAFVLYSAGNISWEVKRVGGTSGPVYEPYVAVDGAGSLHMTYYTEGTLIHAVRTQDGWERSTVVSASVVRTSPLAFDPSGHPHICYQVLAEGSRFPSLMHAEQDGSVWIDSMVSNSSYPGSQSIFVDAASVVHIAFVRENDVIYSNNSDGYWVETTLFEYPGEFNWQLVDSGTTSITVDNAGQPHVAVSYNRGSIGVFSHEGGNWSRHTIFNWGLTFDSVSITSDGSGRLLVSYWGYPSGEFGLMGLMLASRNAGTWDVESVHARADVNVNEFMCALTVGEDGQIRIAVWEAGSDGITLGVYRQSGGNWDFDKVIEYGDHEYFSPSRISICVDEGGHTVLPIGRGAVEYADDSPGFLYSLYAVLPLALASYAVGLLVWGAFLIALRTRSPRS
jgi:hypothetical protein